MRRFLWLSLGALALAGVAVASSGGATQAEARWIITDLGTLGGEDGEAMDVNDFGQVVGGAETRSGYMHAVLWSKRKVIDLGTLPGRKESIATAINDRGQIVGYSFNTSPRDESTEIEARAFLWEQGRMRALGAAGGGYKKALDLNDRAQIVGQSQTGKGKHAVLWLESTTGVDLGTFGGPGSEAAGVNSRGQVVGYATTAKYTHGNPTRHAFLWQSGKMRDLGTLGEPESEAEAVNAQGLIVGFVDTTTTWDGLLLYHAFLWQNGRMRDLDTSRNTFSIAYDINDQGQVVGDIDGRAFLWQNGRKILLGAIRGGHGGYAYGINAKGQIVGASYKGNASHAVLWTLKR